MKIYVLIWKYIEMRKSLIEDLDQVFKGNKRVAKEVIDKFRALKHEKNNIVINLGEYVKDTGRGNVEDILFNNVPFISLLGNNI